MKAEDDEETVAMLECGDRSMLKATRKNIMGPGSKITLWRQGQVYGFVQPPVVNVLPLS